MVDATILTLALTGDSMIMRRVTRTQDAAELRLIAEIQAADVAFTNLEVLPTNFRGHPVQDSGGDHMAAHDWVVDELSAMGFELFATATNHTLDFGVEGVLAMLEVLDAKGVSYAGVGRNLGEARMPVYHDSPAGCVSLLACCSTFQRGSQAGAQRPDFQGRPGLNPVRYTTTYQVRPEQLDALREIAEELGLARQWRERIALGFVAPPDDPEMLPFLQQNFRPAAEPAIVRTLDPGDLAVHSAWVREARMRSDIVVVSIHAHEQGASKEEPADFIPVFARRMIDEGTDVVVGHGPHLLRGMELYQGKPIFYSLGNFIDQHDLIYKMPADAYDRFRVDQAHTPGELARQRSRDDTAGFAADPRYWQTIMPVCRFEGRELTELRLLPVTLGFGLPVHRRGKPALASSDEARRILTYFAELSAPFGVNIDGDEGRVLLG